MKKIISFLLLISMLAAACPVMAARGYQFQWIECEDEAVTLSGDYKKTSDSNASGGASWTLDSTNETAHETKVNFRLSNSGEYDIFILGSPGATDWASARRWKLNDGEYQSEAAENLGKAYNTATARGAGLSWLKLTTQELQRGNNSLSFYTDKKRTLGSDFCYSVLDVIAVVPTSWGWTPNGINVKPYNKDKIKINCAGGSVISKNGTSVSAKAEFKISEKVSADLPIFAELAYNGEAVARVEKKPEQSMTSWIKGFTYSEAFDFELPFNAPDGEYELRAGVVGIELESGEESAVIDTIQIGDGNEEVQEYTVDFSNIQIPDTIEKGKAFSVSADMNFSKEPDFDTTPYLSLWKDGLLWEVLEGNTKVNTNSVNFSLTLTSDMPEGEYEAKIGIHKIHSDVTAKKVKVSGTDSIRSSYHKPMSYGYHKSSTGREIFWYINQVNTAIYNGEPYIPFGGMFVPTYIYYYNASTPEKNKANFEQDVEDLELIRVTGVNDLYINPVRNGDAVPAWAWKYFLDYLEENGWYYGLQLNCTKTDKLEFYYPHATEASGQFKVENVQKSGTVTLKASKSYMDGFISATSALYVAVDDLTGAVANSGEGRLKLADDGELIFEADVKIENEGSYTVYFAPKIYGSFTHGVNWWDDYEYYYSRLRNFVSKMKAGDNLRMAVDLVENEMGIYNHIESTRIFADNFNGLYKEWLINKYGDISELNKAWKAEPAIPDFDEAVLLIPIVTSEKDENNNSYTYYVNDKTGATYKLDTHSGTSWNDYLDARDDTFLEFNNNCADVVKESLNIPIIFKHCALHRRYFVNKDTVGGIDGVGSEAYGAKEKIESMIGTTGSHANQFARTAWNVITETNTEENITGKYKSGLWGYPSEEEFSTRFKAVLDNGTKGIYDFLLQDRPDLGGIMTKTYSWIANPNTIEWAKNFNDFLNKPENQKKYAYTQYAKDTFYFYPSHKNWWWKPNERGVVQLLDDYLAIRRLKTEGNNHVIQTDSLDVDTRVIFINLQDGPYSNIFGPALSEFMNENHPDKRIVVLGHRNDLGTIPEIDKYFTSEKAVINENGETVQVLNPNGAEVLKTTEDGKPWAIKAGNLYIVSSDMCITHSGEFGTLHYVDELGITDVSELTD